jgi:hypothetical protein
MTMENLELYENFSQEREIEFTSRSGRKILVKILGGRITSIENNAGVNFPYSPGQQLTRNIETWACNNGFLMDGKSTCPEKKIFGVKASDVPAGHEWRRLFPNKFR